MLKGKEFLKLTDQSVAQNPPPIDELLGPPFPHFSDYHWTEMVRSGVMGGGHLSTSTFQHVSHQSAHVSDLVFQITAATEIKLYSSFNKNQKE